MSGSGPRKPKDKPGVKMESEHMPCGGCGGPHQYDTSVPSQAWNEVIRAQGLSEYLCTSCIVREFVRAGRSFSAALWGLEFHGVVIEVRVAERAATDQGREIERLLGERAQLWKEIDALRERLKE